jgi:hypothetical protein
MPKIAAVAAAMGTVRDSPWMPVNRSPIRWVSRMYTAQPTAESPAKLSPATLT